MFVSSMLIGTAMFAAQGDPTRAPREAFTACLSEFVRSSLNTDRKTAEQFNAALPQQCLDQERAYREAMIRKDVAARISQAEAEAAAADEISYARENAQGNFTNALPD
jgi:hypothetical protein